MTDFPNAAEAGENVRPGEPAPPELEPFAPPRDFDHGDEFDPPPPRPLPRYVKAGSYARRQRGILYTLVALGIAFIVFWPLPFVQELSYYILPLQWLHWIGVGLIVIAVVKFFWRFLDPGRYRYIREGVPFVGRILAVGRIAGGTAEAPQFKFVSSAEFDHPETGARQIATLEADEYWPLAQAERHSCTLEPGEYVTLVSLPGRFDSTARVYGFLGLDPDREFLLKDGRPLKGTSPFNAIMVAFAISVGVLILMGLFDLVMFSFPTGGGGWKLPVSIAVCGAVVGALVGLIVRKLGSSGNPQQKSSPGAIIAGGFLGAIAAPLLLFILNAQLDSSGPDLKPIEIVNYWENTTNLVIRDYEIEYRNLAGGPTKKRHIRHSQIRKLGDSTQAVMDVGKGRFGYHWVRGIHPVTWVQVDAPADAPGPVFQLSVDVQDEAGDASKLSIMVSPTIELSSGEFVPVPAALLDNAVSRLKISFPDATPLDDGSEPPAEEQGASPPPAANPPEPVGPADR